VAAKTHHATSNAGRKSAYVARNRRALLLATQRVLSTIGPEATIDEVAAQAQVAVSTIYQHFESKELLFSTAITLLLIMIVELLFSRKQAFRTNTV
jgi:AcrR family transcriptional regulator